MSAYFSEMIRCLYLLALICLLLCMKYLTFSRVPWTTWKWTTSVRTKWAGFYVPFFHVLWSTLSGQLKCWLDIIWWNLFLGSCWIYIHSLLIHNCASFFKTFVSKRWTQLKDWSLLPLSNMLYQPCPMAFSGSTRNLGWTPFANIWLSMTAKRGKTAVRSVMKTLAATLSRQRGIQYEFGPEYAEYTASKAAHAREEGGMSQKKSPMVVTGINGLFECK